MFALRTALLEWDLNRVTRVATAGLGVFFALHLTDGFVTEIGATFLFLSVFSVLWEIADRLLGRSFGS
ncbi:hypothetical protein SAMN04489841_2736 [Natrinema salaciae]|uniref:Uncharacterized protein n=1 Tax=Natrinema salaciae TaxID=1186196 RepID=A0A1H9JZH8_9EURY|nr:hypothetical protein SAMN04489841_2736 [Natrinema salaciae]